MYDGYFVHYFAPRGLPVVPKDVIFVIDVSGSMIGTKIKQVKWTKPHGLTVANAYSSNMSKLFCKDIMQFLSIILIISVSRPSRP